MTDDMRQENGLATRIVLVRHGRPRIDPDRPAGEWGLDADAEPEVGRLADRMRGLGLDRIVSSPEAKAVGTAQALAGVLELEITVDDALREQGGDSVPWIGDPAAFRKAVADHFADPEDILLGNESSTAAAARFAGAVDRGRKDVGLPAFVTHGRVMCGYLARVLGIDAMTIWQGLAMPDAFAVDLVSGTLERIAVEEE